jgi:hypothetical protein
MWEIEARLARPALELLLDGRIIVSPRDGSSTSAPILDVQIPTDHARNLRGKNSF